MVVQKPQQDRSRKRLNDILDATDRLLRTRPFAEISVAMIISEAKCSTGSFYARFESKDDLLAALYDRYHEQTAERTKKLQSRRTDNPLSLSQSCALVAKDMVSGFVGRENLMRAMVIYARTNPGNVEQHAQERLFVFKEIADLIHRSDQEIRHKDRDEAVRVGLFMMATFIREAILFGHTPVARYGAQHEPDQIAHTAARMLTAYLTSSDGEK